LEALLILVGVALAFWALFSSVRYGFEGRPKEGDPESSSAASEDHLGCTEWFALVTLVGAILMIARASWLALGN
jgi:hypothetical protein